MCHWLANVNETLRFDRKVSSHSYYFVSSIQNVNGLSHCYGTFGISLKSREFDLGNLGTWQGTEVKLYAEVYTIPYTSTCLAMLSACEFFGREHCVYDDNKVPIVITLCTRKYVI